MSCSISSSEAPGSPILRLLNDDVLEEIFSTFLRACAVENDGSPPTFRDAILLTHICKRWREVAVNFSFLWSWFSLTIIYPNTNYTSLLRLFLQRAGSHPLSFEFYEWHRSETPNVTNSVLRFLLEKHDLWKDVDITLAGYPDVLSDITEGYFPVLESVAFVADKAWTPEQRLHVWRVLHSSSAIQRVMLNEFCDSIPWFDVVPWHNLRYLDINMSINPDELLEILKLCEELECLRFGGDLQSVEWRTPLLVDVPSPIVLARVQQMYLTFNEPIFITEPPVGATIGQKVFEWFMNSISTPSLTRLDIWLRRKYPPDPFVKFCRVSGCRLRHFKLCYEYESRDEEASEWLRLSNKKSDRRL